MQFGTGLRAHEHVGIVRDVLKNRAMMGLCGDRQEYKCQIEGGIWPVDLLSPCSEIASDSIVLKIWIADELCLCGTSSLDTLPFQERHGCVL